MRRGRDHRSDGPVRFDADLAVIADWRRRRLQQAGFDSASARSLAENPRTDLHKLLELVDRGCPPHLAARIGAPLDAYGER